MATIGRAQRALATNNFHPAEKLVEHIAPELGIKIDKADPLYRLLCRNVLRGAIGISEVTLARLDGRYDVTPSDPEFSRPQAPTSSDWSAQRKQSGTPVEEAIEQHLASMKRLWERQTLAQIEVTLRMFGEFVGRRDLGDISRKDVVAFSDALAQFPSKWGQLPRYRGLAVDDAIRLASSEPADMKRLSGKTLNRHLSAVSGLFSWAKDRGLYEGENPASGLIRRGKAGAGRKITRRPWKTAEIRKLFALPVWRGCKSRFYRLQPGKLVIRDGRFFIPLMGLYTGMRLEEICKLTVSDIRQDGDIWVIDVTGNEEGAVKEAASNRTVPVHPELIKLGFLAHVDRIREERQSRLWPELEKRGIDRRYSVAFSKWFGRACDQAGVADPTVVFHSFRHNVGDALRAEGVPESLAAEILGHAHSSMSYRVYARGAAVRTLYGAITKVRYDVDLSELYISR